MLYVLDWVATYLSFEDASTGVAACLQVLAAPILLELGLSLMLRASGLDRVKRKRGSALHDNAINVLTGLLVALSIILLYGASRFFRNLGPLAIADYDFVVACLFAVREHQKLR